jgi:hypothetical protein
MMKTDRPRCSVCGDNVLINGWVLSHHELYCIQCARVNILVKAARTRDHLGAGTKGSLLGAVFLAVEKNARKNGPAN